jgi:hypothetical protein
MGLDILVQYSDKKDDYSYGFRLSYSGYHAFMDEILRYFGFKGKRAELFYSLKGAPNCPEPDLNKLEMYKHEDDFKEYMDSVLEFEAAGILDLVPLALHSDCDGVIPWEYSEKILNLLDNDKAKLWFQLESEWDEEYTELIKTLKDAVDNKALIVYA